MRSESKRLTIGQVAKGAGVPTTTVRYYERIGLVKPNARTGANYRSYGPESLDRLRFIRTAQSAGLSLDDVASLLRLADSDAQPCSDVLVILRDRLAQIDQKLEELRIVRTAVVSALKECQCAPRGGLCADLTKLVEI